MHTEYSRNPNASANWLRVFPAKTEQDRNKLLEIEQALGDFPDTQGIVLALSDAIDTKMFKGKKLTNNDLSLYREVLDFITEGLRIGADEAVSLRLRRITDSVSKSEAQLRAEVKKVVEIWSYYSGDYRGQIVDTSDSHSEKSRDLFDQEYVPHKENGDTVQFLRLRIEQLLKLERERPVVLVDIGAMYGTTLLELAGVFENEIKAGKLVLVATNIGLNRKIIEETKKPTNGNGVPDNYDNLYSAYGNLVHFVTGDVEQLKGKIIALPNGARLTLEPGSIDIAHENWSIVAHSTSLEKDIADLADLVGATGIIMSRINDPMRGSGGLVRNKSTSDYLPSAYFLTSSLSNAKMSDPLQLQQYTMQDGFKMRDIRIEMRRAAIESLFQRSYSYVDEVVDPENGKLCALNYSFFVGKQSEPLHVYTKKGKEVVIEPQTRKKNGLFLRILKRVFRGKH